MSHTENGQSEPVAAASWQHFADYCFAASPVRDRVASDPARFIARYADLHHLGDATADPLAQAIVDGRVARADFEQALHHGMTSLDRPATELVEFFATVDRVPTCLDQSAVDRGALLMRRLPPTVTVAYGMISGFTFAAINPNSAIALSLNNAIVESTHRRYVETMKYVHDTYSDGGRERSSPAFATACRVRLVHAFVRTEIERHVDWNTAAYGSPINMFQVLIAASVSGTWMIPFAEQAGYRFSSAEKSDIAEFTAYLALMQGVPESHVLRTFDDWSELVYGCLATSPLPLPDDVAAAQRVLRPLIEDGFPVSPNPRLTTWFNDYVLETTRQAFGDAMCDEWAIRPGRSGATARRALSWTNRALAACHRTELLRPLHDRCCDRYWAVSVPNMIQRVTGHLDIDYSDTAAVAGAA